MASLKNVDKAKQRIHKERPQLSHRKCLGELERKKDYKQRARSHQRKKQALKTLSQKALERNPDEFYFHMINSKLDNGRHIEKEKRESEETTAEQEKLMRTQNLRYITFKLNQERKKIEKLMSELHLNDPNLILNKRIKFADNGESSSGRKPLRVKTHPSLLKKNEPNSNLFFDPEFYETVDQERKHMYEELTNRIAREKELNVVRQKLMTKQLVTDSRRRGEKPKKLKAGRVNRAAVYVWPQERKK